MSEPPPGCRRADRAVNGVGCAEALGGFLQLPAGSVCAFQRSGLGIAGLRGLPTRQLIPGERGGSLPECGSWAGRVFGPEGTRSAGLALQFVPRGAAALPADRSLRAPAPGIRLRAFRSEESRSYVAISHLFNVFLRAGHRKRVSWRGLAGAPAVLRRRNEAVMRLLARVARGPGDPLAVTRVVWRAAFALC